MRAIFFTIQICLSLFESYLEKSALKLTEGYTFKGKTKCALQTIKSAKLLKRWCFFAFCVMLYFVSYLFY